MSHNRNPMGTILKCLIIETHWEQLINYTIFKQKLYCLENDAINLIPSTYTDDSDPPWN